MHLRQEQNCENSIDIIDEDTGMTIAHVNGANDGEEDIGPVEAAFARRVCESENCMAGILGMLGNVDHSIGNGVQAAKLRGDMLNDIRSLIRSI